MVGIANNLVYYTAYTLLIWLHFPYLIANSLGFIVSIFNAYYWNNKYVFPNNCDSDRVWWKVLGKTFIAYSGTGLIINNILLIVWIDYLEIHRMLAPILSLVITIPLNFVMNKFWAYKKEGKTEKNVENFEV